MKVIVDFCLIPLNAETSLSPYIAACQQVLQEAGLEIHLHAYGTNIEGEWEAVMAAIKACHEKVHSMGAPRISTTIKLGTRVDKPQSMRDKVTHVKALMGNVTIT
jgi:uncharacterized protein (TIGR00106 family)